MALAEGAPGNNRDELESRQSEFDQMAQRVESIITEAHSSVKRENQRAAELMWALSSAGATETTESIVTRGGVEACMHMLSAGTDLYIQRCSMSAIANLLDIDERTKSMVLDEGGLSFILEAFTSRDKEMQKCGLRCIMSLVKHLETRQALMNEKSFVHTLMAIGLNPYDDATAYFVVSTLDVVTRKEEFAHIVGDHESAGGEKDALQLLTKLCANSKPDDVVAEAVRVIFNLTVSVENRTADKCELRERLEEPQVMDLLRGLTAETKPIEVRCGASDALAILTNNQDLILELEAEHGLNFNCPRQIGEIGEDEENKTSK